MVDSSQALTRVSSPTTELALPTDLIEQARDYAVNSRSERTQREYARCWNQFQAWCDAKGQIALPASVQVLIAYVVDLATNGGPKGKPLAVSSIQQAISALLLYHSMKGAPVEAFASPVLKDVLKGIRRKIAETRTIRRVHPLMEKELGQILDMLRPDVLRDARDAAILALGFGGARRRSEIVSLDYMVRGDQPDGRGVLVIDEHGVTIRLTKSKTNQEGAEEEYVLPRMVVPRSCAAVENWITLAGIGKGEPVFRGVHCGGQTRNKHSGYPGVTWREASETWQAVVKINGKTRHLGSYKNPHDAHLAICKATGKTPSSPSAGRVLARRLKPAAVAIIVKKRVSELLMAQTGRRNIKANEVADIVAEYSGHSLRSGHASSAAERGVDRHIIKMATGHKSDNQLGTYIRSSDKRRNSSLKGSGL